MNTLHLMSHKFIVTSLFRYLCNQACHVIIYCFGCSAEHRTIEGNKITPLLVTAQSFQHRGVLADL